MRDLIDERGMYGAYEALLVVPLEEVRNYFGEERAEKVLTTAAHGILWRGFGTTPPAFRSRAELRASLWSHLHVEGLAGLPLWSDAAAFSPHAADAGDAWQRLSVHDSTLLRRLQRGRELPDVDSVPDSGSDEGTDFLGSDSDPGEPSSPPPPARARNLKASTAALLKVMNARLTAAHMRLLTWEPLLRSSSARDGAGSSVIERAAAELLAPLSVEFTQLIGSTLLVEGCLGSDGGYVSEDDDGEDMLAEFWPGKRRQVHLCTTRFDVAALAAVAGPLDSQQPSDDSRVLHLLSPSPLRSMVFMSREARKARVRAAHRSGAPPVILSWECDDGNDEGASAFIIYESMLSADSLRRMTVTQQAELRDVAVSDTLTMLRQLAASRLLPMRCVHELKNYIVRRNGSATALTLRDELDTLSTLDVLSIARYVRRRYDLRFAYTEEWQAQHERDNPRQAPKAYKLSSEGSKPVLRPNDPVLRLRDDEPLTEQAIMDALARILDDQQLRCVEEGAHLCMCPWFADAAARRPAFNYHRAVPCAARRPRRRSTSCWTGCGAQCVECGLQLHSCWR